MTYTRKVTHTEDWWTTAPAHIHRCTAHYKSGDRCRRESVKGTNVCEQHGGAIPAVVQKAATRIGMSVDAAVKRLMEMLDDPKVETREKVKILHDLLDRGGLGATSKVLVGIGQSDNVETFFRDLLSDPAILINPTPEPKTPEQLAWERQEMLDAGFTPPPLVIEAGATVAEPQAVEDVEDVLGTLPPRRPRTLTDADGQPVPQARDAQGWAAGPRASRSGLRSGDDGPTDAPQHIRDGFARLKAMGLA
ncbi:hypothetical protein KIN34_14305 [Cellulomonas sp. DKR-3]|uniref:Uncharacterized protein n=1 Tax=Cellulomonas fulva TaxID=2835530 RepID=A0ABS5U2C0_9CELL|nr:hypothetical protein [Cellulomonas fulva]MBT0995456.1 hypothetical protein [Cellulomonas fulva]